MTLGESSGMGPGTGVLPGAGDFVSRYFGGSGEWE